MYLCLAAPLPFAAATAQGETPDRTKVEERPLGRGLETFVPGKNTSGPETTSPNAGWTETLTLAQALELAVRHNPTLSASSWNVRIGDARIEQASLRPNPEVALSTEGFPGTGENSSVKSTEVSLGISQLVEMGGKRAARIRVAGADLERSAWDYEALRLDVVTETATAYLDILRLQEGLKSDDEMLLLTEESLRAVTRLKESAKALPIELSRANLAVIDARSQRDQTVLALGRAKLRLAALWGGSEVCFGSVSGDLGTLPAVPKMETLLARMAQNPDIARWSAEIAWRDAVLDNESRLAKPDVTVGVGLKRNLGTDSNSLTLGVSIPWPRSNRNQGAIREARYERERAAQMQAAETQRLCAVLTEAVQRLEAASSMVNALQNEMLPAARQVCETARSHYEVGRLGQLDVIEAQRGYHEISLRLLDARREYHEAAIRIERLIGEPLSAFAKSN